MTRDPSKIVTAHEQQKIEVTNGSDVRSRVQEDARVSHEKVVCQRDAHPHEENVVVVVGDGEVEVVLQIVDAEGFVTDLAVDLCEGRWG